MNQFLGVDSKLVQFFTLLGNLILLNLLWILTSLPIITAGAASAAMYAVIFQYAEGTDDAVLKPFIKSFLSNFRQSTLLWIPICLLFIMLGIDMVFLIGNAASGIAPLLWVPVVLISFLTAVILTYSFPLIAKFSAPLRNVLRNSVCLFFLNFFPSAGILMLNLLPWGLMLLAPRLFFRTGILWFLLGFSLIAYLNSRILLKIFKKYLAESSPQP